MVVLHAGRPILARIVRGWIRAAGTGRRVAA